MVLHGIALYDLVFYTIYFACYCIVRFVAWAVSRKTPIPSQTVSQMVEFSQGYFWGTYECVLGA